MPTLPADCANYELNLQMCPCTNTDCGNRGICCECVQAHYAAGKPNACMRGAKRNPDTMGLALQAAKTCATNQARNKEFCKCTYDPCERKGVCCSCVRNHFTVDGTGRVACMKFG
ncbi:hypothetical protein LLH23_09720 [bacterium]|nr:hypothetical protein [bacterium]